MNTMDAAFNVAHEYPGGAKQLGARIGLTDLSDRVNPNLGHRLLGLEHAVRMQLISGDYRVLYAMALELRHYPPVPMPDLVPGEEPCLQTLAELVREVGDLITEVSKDLADGKVKNHELAAVKQKWGELVSTGQHLIAQMTAMNEALRALAPGDAE